MHIAFNEHRWNQLPAMVRNRWSEAFSAAGHDVRIDDAPFEEAHLLADPVDDGDVLVLSHARHRERSIAVRLTPPVEMRSRLPNVPVATIDPPTATAADVAHDPDIRCIVSSAADPDHTAVVRSAADRLGVPFHVRSTIDPSDGGAVFFDVDQRPVPGPTAATAAANGLIVVCLGGEPVESDLIKHGLTGLRVSADEAGADWALRHLAAHPGDAQRYALNARRSVADRSWALLDGLLADLANPAERKRVCIVNAFAVDTPVNGGQRRLRQLAEGLALVADVELLVLSQHAEQTRRRLLAPGLVQIEVPRSAEQKQAEQTIYELMGFPTDDVTVAALSATTPAWAAELAERIAGADLVISSHPYLAPTIPNVDGQPFVYDSHNAEAAFKRSVFADDVDGNWLAAEAERVERIAAQRADLISACTEHDLAEIRSLDPGADHHGVIVSNGVDIDALPFATADQSLRARWELLGLAGVDAYSDRPIVTFIGSSHAPNLSAAELLIEAATLRPDWLFILAGSHSSTLAERSTAPPPNVTLIPVFDEGLLWPLIAGADVAANPMVSGGGSNLKIFDYLAVGTPVLATTIGARGLDQPDEYVELAESDVDGVVAGLDRLVDPELADLRRERSRSGRAFVETNVSWDVLGERWADALGELVGGWTGPRRPRLETSTPIILLDTPPPSTDPVIGAMQLVGLASSGGVPPPREVTVDPAFREHVRKAKANKNVGRELPEDARLALPKKALIRAGHALSNEQSVFNDASIAAMERLMEVINDLRRDQFALVERLAAAETALANGTPLEASTAPSVAPSTSSAPEPDLDAFYEAFEDAFRGSPDDVAASSAHYLERLGELPTGPIVDIGCGRGEWLALLADRSLEAYGFDTNAVAIDRCIAADLDARHGDGVTHLESVAPGSVAAVSAFHVIEHLTFAEMHRLVVAAHRALAPGGRLLLETPNCLNLQVGASSFWLDPTHRSPVHPEQLRFLLRHVGFDDVDVFGLHPDEASAPTDLDPDPARNGLLTELHRLVFGSLDLAAVATKR